MAAPTAPTPWFAGATRGSISASDARRGLMSAWAPLPLLLASAALAQAPPRVRPEDVGFSSARLARLHATMQDYVDQGRLAGAVTLLLRDGKLAHLDAVGKADAERGVPMAPNTIFRIASQSKALTSVALMMLVEEGRVRLNDPVAKFIPAFVQTTVAVDSSDGQGRHWLGRLPAKRPITIRDLLTHTA